MRQSIYKNYLLILLMIILAFNYVDRMAIGIVLEDIKNEFALSDTNLGLLSGVAFALFYAAMGIPIARWADCGNRVTIISVTAVLWSVMVSLCGMAANFAQLLLIRVGVGVGEAGCIPPAHSLLADYFPRAERPRAAAIYALGYPLAAVVGYVLAGWLNELYGWRSTFIILGSPGLVLAAIAWFTLREPRKANGAGGIGRAARDAPISTRPSVTEVFATLWGNATFRNLLFCYVVVFFFGYGITLWQPTFFIRSYGLKTAEVGMWLAVILGVGGMVGTYLGGALASRYATNREPLQLRWVAIANIGYGVLSFCAYISPNKFLAFGLLAMATLTGAAVYGPLGAALQTLVPERMRAMAIALVYFLANLVGMGLGPLATGALSDVLQLSSGQESLRYSLLIFCTGSIWAAWHAWRASRTVVHDLCAAEAEHDSVGFNTSTEMAEMDRRADELRTIA